LLLLCLLFTIVAVSLFILFFVEKQKNERAEAAKRRFADMVDVPQSAEFILIYKRVQQLLAQSREAYNRLSARQENLMTILDNLGEALLITSDDGRIEYVNKSARDLSSKELLGRKISEGIDNYYIGDLLDEVIIRVVGVPWA